MGTDSDRIHQLIDSLVNRSDLKRLLQHLQLKHRNNTVVSMFFPVDLPNKALRKRILKHIRVLNTYVEV